MAISFQISWMLFLAVCPSCANAGAWGSGEVRLTDKELHHRGTCFSKSECDEETVEPKKKVKVKIFKFTFTLKVLLLKKKPFLSLPPTLPHAPQPTQKDKTNLKTCCYSDSEGRASGDVTVGSENNGHRNSLVADSFRT